MAGADPTKRAFAAGLMLGEVEEVASHVHHAVSSSITTMPPEPIMAPACVRESKSTGVSRKLPGRQPPDGPPICTALNSCVLGYAAADIEDELAQGRAHGHSQPGRHDGPCPPRKRWPFPGCLAVPNGSETSSPACEDRGDSGRGFSRC